MSDPTVQRLASTDAFVLTDFPAAERADGVVRCARKVLVDSTRSLARSRTYSWALLGFQVSGASAAINAEGEDRGPAIEAFCDEVNPLAESGALTLAPAKGVSAEDLSALAELVEPDPQSFAAGIVAAAGAVRSLDGARVAVEFDGGAAEALDSALTSAGAEVVASGAEALVADADLLLFGSRAGLIDHETVGTVTAQILVPTGNLGITPRALAVAGRTGKTVLADFLTTAGPLAKREGCDVPTTIGELAARSVGHEDGSVLGACSIAEEFLSSWVDELPFGRPI